MGGVSGEPNEGGGAIHQQTGNEEKNRAGIVPTSAAREKRMKRDMELARKILEQVEEKSVGVGPCTLEIAGYSEPDVSYNVKLLSQAGFLGVNGIIEDAAIAALERLVQKYQKEHGGPVPVPVRPGAKIGT